MLDEGFMVTILDKNTGRRGNLALDGLWKDERVQMIYKFTS